MEHFSTDNGLEVKKETQQERHGHWVREARVILEGIGFHVAVGVPAFFILKHLGVELPPGVLTAIQTPTTMGFMNGRRQKLKQASEN